MRLGSDKKIMEFIRLYEEHRFRGRELDREARVKCERLGHDIKKKLKGRPRSDTVFFPSVFAD